MPTLNQSSTRQESGHAGSAPVAVVPTASDNRKMSVEHPNVIDAIGLKDAGAKIVMVVSDHLSWDDPEHIPLLAANNRGICAGPTAG